MKLELVTLAGVKLSTDVYEVVLQTESGEIGVFPGHEPLITLARPGVIAVRRRPADPDDLMEYFAASGGIVEITGQLVRVLVDEADHGDDILEAEVEAALQRAVKLRDEATDRVELAKAQTMVDRHATRLKVAGLRRHRNKTKLK
jgi:F-type H+-transporting ATPase subunit epsilon